jgi:hypothetical protein
MTPAADGYAALLRRSVLAATLCVTKQLNKIPSSSEPFVNLFVIQQQA